MSTDKQIEDAKNRIIEGLKYFRHMLSEAKKKGKVEFGIIAVNEDGSGNIEARFDCEEFFNDIAIAVNAPKQTEKDDLQAKAARFLQIHGITK